MRIGILGYGSIGKRHFANLLAMGEKDIRVHDVQLGIHPYGPLDLRFIQLNELWAWQPEAVLICTPPATHYKLACDAIDHGCHIFCEKPLATHVLEANDIVWRNDEKKVLAVGYQLRWTMTNFRQEAYGHNAKFTVGQNMTTWPSQYQKDVLGEFSHEIDASVFVNGPVESVTASVHGQSWHLQLRHLYTNSDILIMADCQAPPVRFANANGGTVSWVFDEARNDLAYKQEVSSFLSACEGVPVDYRLCSGAEAVHVVKIIAACRESALNCKVVHLA